MIIQFLMIAGNQVYKLAQLGLIKLITLSDMGSGYPLYDMCPPPT